jgi:DNA-binding LacI/PurR family transcriptional regulator
MDNIKHWPMNAIHQRVCRHIVSGILSGTFAAGGRIPTEQELAAAFGTSRMNVHGAVKTLEGRQIVERRRRAGTFVRPGLAAGDMQALLSATSDQVHLLLPPSTLAQVHWNDHTVADIEQRLNTGGCQAQFIEMPADRQAMESCLDGLTHQGSKAVVVLPDSACENLLRACADIFARSRLDLFLLNRGDLPTDCIRCHMLCLDPFDEGLQVALHAQERGWRRVAFAATATDGPVTWSVARRDGLRAGLAGCADTAFEEVVVDRRAPWDALAHLWQPADDPLPPLIVAQNDALGADILDAAAAAGRTVNKDFHLIGFDDDPQFRHCNLTTMAPPLAAMAEALAEVVLNGFPVTGSSQLMLRLRSRLVIRSTTATEMLW